MCHFGAHLLCTSVLFRDACTRKNWWIFEETPKGEVISDLKRFIANLVLNQPEFWSWISEKNCNIFSQKRDGSGGGKGRLEVLQKVINFWQYRRPLKAWFFCFFSCSWQSWVPWFIRPGRALVCYFEAWFMCYFSCIVHLCMLLLSSWILYQTWTCSGLLFWSLIYVLRQSALRGTWPGFLPWLSLSQHLTTRLSCTEAQDDDYDDYDDDDHDD